MQGWGWGWTQGMCSGCVGGNWGERAARLGLVLTLMLMPSKKWGWELGGGAHPAANLHPSSVLVQKGPSAVSQLPPICRAPKSPAFHPNTPRDFLPGSRAGCIPADVPRKWDWGSARAKGASGGVPGAAGCLQHGAEELCWGLNAPEGLVLPPSLQKSCPTAASLPPRTGWGCWQPCPGLDLSNASGFQLGSWHGD